MSNQNIGTVTQIIGPVLDIKFPDGHLPGLLNAITVENGVAFLGVDSEKQPIGFAVGELAEITLRDADGNFLPDDRKHWSHAVICFVLQDGSEREYRAHWLTKNQYQSIRAYFEHRSH